MLKKLIVDSGVSFRQNSVSWIFTCPKCSKREKLYLRKRDGRFVCWHCATTENFKGKAEYALRELLGVNITRLREWLYGVNVNASYSNFVVEVNDFFGDDDVIPEDLFIVEHLEVDYPFDYFPIDDPAAAKGLAYLVEERGFTPALAKEFDIRYNPEARRVIFPVIVNGKLIGWQGRAIDKNTTAKILSSKGVNRESALMFQDNLKGAKELTLLEGPITGVKCHLCPGMVVSMGKSVSEGQLRIMIASGIKRWNLGLDRDAARELTRLCRIAAGEGIEVYRMLPDPGKNGKGDFGDMHPHAAYMAYKNARRIMAGQVFIPPLVDRFSQVVVGDV